MARKRSLIEGFWSRIDKVLQDNNISKSQVAKLMGCDRKTIYQREGTMNPLYIAKFCAVTGADANWLLGIPYRSYGQTGHYKVSAHYLNGEEVNFFE